MTGALVGPDDAPGTAAAAGGAGGEGGAVGAVAVRAEPVVTGAGNGDALDVGQAVALRVGRGAGGGAAAAADVGRPPAPAGLGGRAAAAADGAAGPAVVAGGPRAAVLAQPRAERAVALCRAAPQGHRVAQPGDHVLGGHQPDL